MGMATQLLRGLWRTLGSTRLAAILLSALLLTSLLASLFPQLPADPATHESWLAAVALRYGQVTRLLHTLGLFDAYQAPWFLALLIALLLNTLACTLQRLSRLWRVLSRPPTVVRPETFYLGLAHRAEWPVPSPQEGLAAMLNRLARHRYRIYTEHREWATYLYAERGRWSQVGTLVSHVAALLLLIAVAARPALGWQENDVTLLPGQVHAIGHGRDIRVRAGSLTVARHPDGQPRDYRVPLTVLVNVSPVMTRSVRINHPLTLRGVAFHLQSYGPAVRVTTPERSLDMAFTSGQTKEITLPDSNLTLRVAYQPEGAALFVEALGADGTLLGSGIVADGDQIEVQGTPITFSLDRYTVWQVSHDPTFGLAVVAAALLLAAAVVSLWVPHRRLWLGVDAGKAQMVGVGDFDTNFETLAVELTQTCCLEGEEKETDG